MGVTSFLRALTFQLHSVSHLPTTTQWSATAGYFVALVSCATTFIDHDISFAVALIIVAATSAVAAYLAPSKSLAALFTAFIVGLILVVVAAPDGGSGWGIIYLLAGFGCALGIHLATAWVRALLWTYR